MQGSTEQPPIRLAIVDDDPLLLRLIGDFFVAQGLDVKTFSSAKEFRIGLESFDIEVLIVDMRMSGEDGSVLVRKLRESGRRNLPVIFLTGEVDFDFSKAFILEAQAAFKKPCSTADLLVAVMSLGNKYRSERVLAERLSQSEKALGEASMLMLLGELAAGVMHDIRNPLTIVKAQLEVVDEIIKNPGENTFSILRVKLDKIHRAVDRVLSIASSFRSASSIQGRNDITNMNKVLEEVSVTFEHRAHLCGVDISFEKNSDLNVRGNLSKIFQVIFNILNNAIDAINDHTDKWIRVRLMIDPDNEKMALLQVVDSGPAISEELAKKIMQPFYTTKETGTGIGLHTSRKICAEIGGTLVLNRDMPNTCFEVRLPISTESKTAA